MYDAWRARMTGNAFDDAGVARCYDARPPYAPAAYDALLARAPRRDTLVDLGCGPGKIAAALAGAFADVLAVDASEPMIARGRELHTARHPNIRWARAPAEEAELPPHIDLVAAGTSIHWMNHAALFPKLARRAALAAIITGDAPPAPPWQEDEARFLTKWLARIGSTYDRARFAARGRGHEAWMDAVGRERFAFTFHQSIANYVACQHSRATFSRSRMGDAVAAAFDDELSALLEPYARDGMVGFELITELTFGVPRETEKSP